MPSDVASPIRLPHTRCRRRFAFHGLLALALAASASAQSQAPLVTPVVLPFAAGERLAYEGRAGAGITGRGEMTVTGPEEVRGVSTLVLRFTFDARVGFLKVSDRTTSWLDPVHMASLRFEKEERRLLARHSERVTMDPSSRHWEDDDGHGGTSPSDAPLDELSFIYAVRTFSLGGDSVMVLNRHFDARRNPTTVRALGRGEVSTPAGTFATREVEMRVRDARNYQGEGVIRFSLSDDACRRPVRIESNIPGAGRVVLLLTEAQPRVGACTPRGE